MATSSARKTASNRPSKGAASARRQPAAARASTAAASAKPGTSPSAKADKKKAKPEKVKVVRDSFTIPKNEYAQIAALKKRAIDFGVEVKKSELIRAGLMLLIATTDSALRKVLAQVPTLKTGRPGKS